MKSKAFAILSCALLSFSLIAQAGAQGVKIPALILQQQTSQADSELNQGRQLLRRGRASEALVHLQSALKLYADAKSDRGVAATHNEIGDLYVRQGQYDNALKHYKDAFNSFRAAQSKQSGAETVMGFADNDFNANLMLAKIGDTNFRLGNAGGAMAAYSQMQVRKPENTAAKVGRKFGFSLPNVVSAATTGSISKPSVSTPTVSNPNDALAIAAEARKEMDQYRLAIVYATYEIGMGRLDFMGAQFDSAKKHFQNALDVAGGKDPIISGLGQTRRFRAAARTSLGDVALKQGRFADAIKAYNDATRGAQEDRRLDLMWPAQRGLGRALWLQAAQTQDAKKSAPMREQSLAAYRDALKTLETIRQGSLRADEARTTFLATTKDVFDEASAALAEMALMSAPTAGATLEGKALDYAAESFKVSEQARSRSLLDLLGETNAQITEGVPADLLKRKQENLDRQQEIAEILTGASLSTEPQKQKPVELEAELDKLQTDYDEIENQIRAQSPRYAALTAAQPLSLAEVQQQVLDDQTALLEYSLGNDASYLWAITKSGASLFKLPARSALDKLAMDFRAQLIPPKLQRRIVGIDVAQADAQRGLGLGVAAPTSEEANAFAAASNALYKAAVEPAANIVGQKRLLVVADGALNYVPFEALVTSSAAADYASLPYLIKTNEIANAPSSSVIAAIRQQNAKPTGRAVLLVADPVFNSNDPRAQKSAAAAPTADGAETRGLGIASALTDVAGTENASAGANAPAEGLPLMRLMGTRTEAEEIAKLTRASGGQADLWLDLDANESNIETRDVKKYRVIHVATHGLLDAERPQFSGVILSLVGNKSGDGFLRTDEVFNLKLGSPLVMLSACETGLGKERRGEGVIGLTRAFMYAGAPTVGVSLWSVADRSTAELMTDFYKRLLTGQGTSPSAALREAQTNMIAGKKYSAPFYWAPFVLVGEWK